MANNDTPFGLRPIGHPSGLSKASIRAYHVASDYGTALFPGDPVIKTGTANTAEVSAPGLGTVQIGALSQVAKATAGDDNAITGVIVGVAADPNNLGRRYIPASTGGVVFVNDDPQTEYEIQADEDIVAADVGANAALVYTNAGSTATGQSGAELDSSTVANTATLQLRILGVIPRTDNEAGSNFTKVRVRINRHSEITAGAGV